MAFFFLVFSRYNAERILEREYLRAGTGPGAEAIHVFDAACRRIVRQMRNPVERHKAAMLHHIAYQFTPALRPSIKKRNGNNKRKTAEAAVTGAASDIVEVLHAAAAAATDATALLMPSAPSLPEVVDATAAIADVWDPR